MLLHSFDGSEFELTLIRGRQWDPHATRWEDADWVRVHLRAQAPFGMFEDGGPYFLNRELLELATWFTAIAHSRDVPSECEFIEHHPWFRLTHQEDRFVTLRVLFSSDYGWAYAKDLKDLPDLPDFPSVEIEISRNQLQVAANQLQAELARLPRHGTYKSPEMHG